MFTAAKIISGGILGNFLRGIPDFLRAATLERKASQIELEKNVRQAELLKKILSSRDIYNVPGISTFTHVIQTLEWVVYQSQKTDKNYVILAKQTLQNIAEWEQRVEKKYRRLPNSVIAQEKEKIFEKLIQIGNASRRILAARNFQTTDQGNNTLRNTPGSP